MKEYNIFKREVRERLSRMDVPGGDFSEREKAILSIVWNNMDEIHGYIQNEMTDKAIEENGGCTKCQSITGLDCICEWEQDQEDLEEMEIDFFNNN